MCSIGNSGGGISAERKTTQSRRASADNKRLEADTPVSRGAVAYSQYSELLRDCWPRGDARPFTWMTKWGIV